MQLDAEHQTFNPWITIWIKPRATIRQIIDTDPTRQVIFLAVLLGLAYSLDRAAARDMGDRLSLSVLFVIMLIMSPISGLLIVYVGGALFRWVGGVVWRAG
ncbi:MAG: hypothetical protein JW953_13370 [Anaerolineae bacterium]|nr:hypothetical protein [Anaerolineae bacterium]